MKTITIISLLTITTFCAKAQTLDELKVKFDAARTEGAKWAAVENWANQQIQAAIKADEKAKVAKAAVQAQLDALKTKLQQAGTNSTLLITLREEAIKNEIERKREDLRKEIVNKQKELDTLR